MKKLSLLFAIVAVLFVAAPCSAQNPVWPYIFTPTGYTCAPMSNCSNYVYIPQGWYGQVIEAGAARCVTALPYAQGYGLNVYGNSSAVCVLNATLITVIIYSDSAWYYAPGNPYAQSNVIWAQQLVAAGAIYAIPNNANAYLISSEYVYEDCYTGYMGQTNNAGGTC